MKKFTYNNVSYTLFNRGESQKEINPHIEETISGYIPRGQQKSILKPFLAANGYKDDDLNDSNHTTHQYVAMGLKVDEVNGVSVINGPEIVNTSSIKVDYKTMFDFMQSYSGKAYAIKSRRLGLVSKGVITQANSDEMNDIETKGDNVLAMLKTVAHFLVNVYKEETNRNLVAVGSNKFTKQNTTINTGCQVRSYLWYQLVDKEFKDSPFSLSLFVEKDTNGQQRIRVCIEMNNEKAKKVSGAKEKYEKLKDSPLSSKLEFVSGSNNDNDIVSLSGNTKDIKQKVQISKTIIRDDSLKNEEYTNDLVEGFKELIPHYQGLIIGTSTTQTTINASASTTGGTIMKQKLGLNMILYGPPGTGKTYNSRIYAVAVCDGRDVEDVMKDDYNSVVTPRFEELVKQGRIKFTTFHQSYGYEEFIEGISPNLDENEKDISYSIKDGVFKDFCKSASALKSISIKDIDPNAKVCKVALGRDAAGKIRKSCFKDGYVRINWPSKEEAEKELSYLNKGDIVLSINTRTSIHGIGVVLDDEMVVLNEPDYKYARKVKWLLTDKIIEVKDKYNNGKYLPIRTIESLPNIKIEDVINMLKDNEINVDTTENKDKYVFIIDEINRGNISKIFGELITLIEPSKRKGAAEASSCILPYSNTSFSVPDNVYILGTMNTADRSIAIMDTALRRRFKFIEMMPKSSVLHGIMVDGIDIEKMLDAINSRITVLYDRDHTIGHAFFTELNSSSDISDLASIFKDKIIPLLQEYFYEDYNKIRLVLGDNAKDEQYQFIKANKNNSKAIFKGNVSQDEISEYNYEINEMAFSEPESYKQII